MRPHKLEAHTQLSRCKCETFWWTWTTIRRALFAQTKNICDNKNSTNTHTQAVCNRRRLRIRSCVVCVCIAFPFVRLYVGALCTTTTTRNNNNNKSTPCICSIHTLPVLSVFTSTIVLLYQHVGCSQFVVRVVHVESSASVAIVHAPLSLMGGLAGWAGWIRWGGDGY